MTQRYLQVLLPCGLAIGLLILVSVLAEPVCSAILIGGDECVEVTKGFLWENGYPLYEKVWNDQPPVYSALLAALFKYCAPTIGVARFLAASFGLSLLAGFFIVVKKHCDLPIACLATFCLITAPIVFGLCVSAMLEVPAIGTGLWALYPLYCWREDRKNGWLIISALIFSIALQIKMTAIVFAPALLSEIILTSNERGQSHFKEGMRNVMLWGVTIFFSFLVLGAAMGVRYNQAFVSHFSQGTLDVTGIPLFGFSLKFSPSIMPWHVDGWAGAALGVLLMILHGDWRRLSFPLILLLTVTVVHLLHRPYWSYYYLHFALPLAWLTGYGVIELYRTILKREDVFSKPSLVSLTSMIAATFLAAAVVGNGLARLFTSVQNIQNLPRVQDSALIKKMKAYKSGTRWVFTEFTIYPFDAGLKVIPELAVLPDKRFWSGQLTKEQMWDIIERYKPEQILLTKIVPFQAKGFIDSNYVLVYEDDDCDDTDNNGHRLYVLRTLDTGTHQ